MVTLGGGFSVNNSLMTPVLGQTFPENSVPPPPGETAHRQKTLTEVLREKIAIDHKTDGHEKTLWQDLGGMTMGW